MIKREPNQVPQGLPPSQQNPPPPGYCVFLPGCFVQFTPLDHPCGAPAVPSHPLHLHSTCLVCLAGFVSLQHLPPVSFSRLRRGSVWWCLLYSEQRLASPRYPPIQLQMGDCDSKCECVSVTEEVVDFHPSHDSNLLCYNREIITVDTAQLQGRGNWFVFF